MHFLVECVRCLQFDTDMLYQHPLDSSFSLDFPVTLFFGQQIKKLVEVNILSKYFYHLLTSNQLPFPSQINK